MADKKVFGNDGPGNPDLPFSTFDKSFTNNLTARVGRAYPVFTDMVPPNSTGHVTSHMAFDMMPTVSPIQASIRCHVSFYKVPLRILQSSYEDFFSQVGNHKVPYIKRPKGWCETGSLADYMGIPTQTFQPKGVRSNLPLRRTGYVDYHFFHDSDSYENGGVLYEDLFHENLVRPSGSLSIADGMDAVALSGLVPGKFYDGLINLPMVFPLGKNLRNQDFGTRDIYCAAVRCTSGSVVSSSFRSGSLEWGPHIERHGDLIVEHIAEDISHDGSPASGTSYPYENLSPGQYALDSSGVVVESVGDFQYETYKMVIRLSNEFLEDLNSMIDRAESGQRVYIVFGWSTGQSSLDLFGSQTSFFPRVNVSHAVSSSEVSLTEPIFSEGTITPEGGEPVTKQNVSQIQIVNHFGYPSSGLQGPGSFNRYYIEKSSDENPFCSYNDEDPKLPVAAYAFRAYEFLHNFVFRNQRVDPFMKPEIDPSTGEVVLQPSYNKFLTNDGDGADSTTPVDFFNVPYEFDMFTMCQKTPQFGDAPLVGITGHGNVDNDIRSVYVRSQVIGDDGQPTGESIDYTIPFRVDPDSEKILAVADSYEEGANRPSLMRLHEMIELGISINDFRSVNAFQIMKERFLKAGYLYPDLHQEFFGCRPPVGENYPEFLGGISRTVAVDKVQNLAKSDQYALGEFAGTGGLEGHSQEVSFHCKEWTMIMGIMWFTVTPIYSQKIDKHFLYNNYFDFYNPALAHIGPQPVFKHQLTPLQMPRDQQGRIDVERLMDVFGYGRPWADLVSKQDEAHGEFRSSMHSYLLQRLFSEPPSLGSSFLYIDSKDLTDIYTYIADTDKFFGAIRFEYFLKMPLPKVSLPRII